MRNQEKTRRRLYGRTSIKTGEHLPPARLLRYAANLGSDAVQENMKLQLVAIDEGSRYEIQSANGRFALRGSRLYAEYTMAAMQKAVDLMEQIPADARKDVVEGLAGLY